MTLNEAAIDRAWNELQAQLYAMKARFLNDPDLETYEELTPEDVFMWFVEGIQ